MESEQTDVNENQINVERTIAQMAYQQSMICDKDGHDELHFNGVPYCGLCGAFPGEIEIITSLRIDGTYIFKGMVFLDDRIFRPVPEETWLTKEGALYADLMDAIEKYGVMSCPSCDKKVNHDPRQWCFMFKGQAVMCKKCGNVFIPLKDQVLDGLDKELVSEGRKEFVKESNYECPECGNAVEDTDVECPFCSSVFDGEDVEELPISRG